MQNFRRHSPFYSCALVLALLSVVWIFIGKGYIPVEVNDEPSHTFIDSPLFFQFLKQQQLYIINLFNNFGTPVIGDAVAVPWAPHGLFYGIMSPIVAMIVNKFLFGFLSLTLLYHFSLTFQPSRMIAAWVAFLSYSNPAFLWFIQHHPHQGVLTYFTLCLLAVERVISKRSASSFAIYFVCTLFLLTGCGINGAFLSCLFLGSYILLNVSRMGLRTFWALTGISTSAFLFTAPQYIAFAKWTPLSARAGFKLFDLPQVHAFDLISLLKTLFFIRVQTGIHMDWGVHLTGIYIFYVLVILYFALDSRRSQDKTNDSLKQVGLVLGVFPTIMVYTLLVRLDWLDRLPLIRSMDPTRFLWFSILFLNNYLGLVVYKTINRRTTFFAWPILAIFSFIAAATIFLISLKEIQSNPQYRIIVNSVLLTNYLLAAIGLVLIWAYPFLSFGEVRISHWKHRKMFLALSLLLTLAPGSPCFLYLNMNWRSVIAQFDFIPLDFATKMTKGARFGGLYDLTPEAPDQRGAVHGLYGSGGRSIILSKHLKTFLAENNLIEEGYLTYNFKPNSPARMASLGIKYLITREDYPYAEKVKALGWRQVSTSSQWVHDYTLFESPLDPSLVYCENPDGSLRFVRNYAITANQISLIVPEMCDERNLIATFHNWPGWQTWIDGIEASAGSHPIFLSVNRVKSGQKINFTFWPRFLDWYPLFVILGLFLLLGILTLARLKIFNKIKV